MCEKPLALLKAWCGCRHRSPSPGLHLSHLASSAVPRPPVGHSPDAKVHVSLDGPKWGSAYQKTPQSEADVLLAGSVHLTAGCARMHATCHQECHCSPGTPTWASAWMPHCTCDSQYRVLACQAQAQRKPQPRLPECKAALLCLLCRHLPVNTCPSQTSLNLCRHQEAAQHHQPVLLRHPRPCAWARLGRPGGCSLPGRASMLARGSRCATGILYPAGAGDGGTAAAAGPAEVGLPSLHVPLVQQMGSHSARCT